MYLYVNKPVQSGVKKVLMTVLLKVQALDFSWKLGYKVT